MPTAYLQQFLPEVSMNKKESGSLLEILLCFSVPQSHLGVLKYIYCRYTVKKQAEVHYILLSELS